MEQPHVLFDRVHGVTRPVTDEEWALRMYQNGKWVIGSPQELAERRAANDATMLRFKLGFGAVLCGAAGAGYYFWGTKGALGVAGGLVGGTAVLALLMGNR